jgi:hypothetical protein
MQLRELTVEVGRYVGMKGSEKVVLVAVINAGGFELLTDPAWMRETSDGVFPINSLPSVNAVLERMQALSEASIGEFVVSETIIPMLTRQRISRGERTGFPLIGTNRFRLFSHLRAAVDEATLRVLEAKMSAEKVEVRGEEWVATWTEVDRLGGAERVIAKGTSRPWSVQKIEREVLLAAGSIPEVVLHSSTLVAPPSSERSGREPHSKGK